MTHGVLLARSSIVEHSKSFSLASKLLPLDVRDAARVVYAWCRRADDAVDQVPAAQQHEALRRLTAELDAVYEASEPSDPLSAAFQRVVRQTGIPRLYPAELLRGMRMDADGQRYATWEDLVLYCYRVAGVVGLMMCHVLAVQEKAALRHAAHLGIAMQITNIARDVVEDWERGRLYLPDSLLAKHGAGGLLTELGGPFPEAEIPALALVVQQLLSEAERYYLSGDQGLRHLNPQAAFAVRTARLIYADIGRQLARRNYDVRSGRAYVTFTRKLFLTARAAVVTCAELPRRLERPFVPAVLADPLSFPHDIFPV